MTTSFTNWVLEKECIADKFIEFPTLLTIMKSIDASSLLGVIVTFDLSTMFIALIKVFESCNLEKAVKIGVLQINIENSSSFWSFFNT